MKSCRTYVLLIAWLFAVCGVFPQVAQGNEARVDTIFKAISVSNRDEESQKTLITTSFDLSNREVSTFMLKAMNRLPQARGEKKGDEVMACVLDVAPAKGLEWLLDHHTNLSAVGRANMVKSLRLLDQTEAYDVAFCFLDDKSEVVNPRAENLSPGPYEHLRVCDYACNTLHHMLSSGSESKIDLPKRVSSDMKRDDRDKILETWKEWQKANATNVLNRKQKLVDKNPGLKNKIAVFREKCKK